MKRSLLLFFIGLLFASLGFSADQNVSCPGYGKTFSADTIKTSSFTFHASRTTAANNPTGIKSMLDSIKTYPASSYILVTRIARDKWVIETNPDMSTLSNYNPKKIYLIEGDIAIMHTKYDTRYAVIMMRFD